MTSVDSNFNFLCGRPHGAGPPSPVHMRPPEPNPLPLPLRVDVINGWPLIVEYNKQFTIYTLIGITNAFSMGRRRNALLTPFLLRICLLVYPGLFVMVRAGTAYR